MLKTNFTPTLIIFLLTFLSINVNAQTLNGSSFKDPSPSAGIHTWWHWMDGNITREGITKDLEAMKQQGITEATIFNIGLFGDKDFGVKKINFNTPGWLDMFQWAVKEANRLGITIGVHNCDGWSTSGGPWITPEQSMKQYVWTKTIVNASQTGTIQLKQPIAYHGFYKDVAVVAFRTNQAQNSFQRAAPDVIFNGNKNADALWDGCPLSMIPVAKGDKITFRFKEPFTAAKISIMTGKAFMWENAVDLTAKYMLSSSADGKDFTKITEFTVKGVNKMVTIPIPKTSAKYFQLTLIETNVFDPYDWDHFSLAECELLPENESPLYLGEIESLPEKSGNGKSADANVNPYSKVNASTLSHLKTVEDLTTKMDPDGTLHWSPTGGNWAILRFGYTTTNAANEPATATGLGLECDKMDTTALNHHFNSFPAKLIEKAGALTGKTFSFMLIDSWEAGYQNWTAAMMKEFQKRRGYGLTPYLPVLCGESSGDAATDEGVLYDLRKTSAELIEENYYRHFAELLHRNKLKLHAEVIYGGLNWPSLDILKATKYVDVPMYEFAALPDNKQMVTYDPVKAVELNMPSCAAVDYDKQVVASEAYTGLAHYSETPADLAPFGNRAFCAGINQLVLHSYIHQPEDKKPGMTLRGWGAHFNRNNTTWPYMSDWFTSQARVHSVLQQGTSFFDILYYAGDQLPQGSFYNKQDKLPEGFNLFGYMLNLCNYDVLKNRIKVVGGKLILNGKTAYSILSLPEGSIDFKTLERIATLVRQGAVLYAPRPSGMLSLHDLKNNQKAFDGLVTALWGSRDNSSVVVNRYGKGKVYCGLPLAEVLKTEHILPDLSTGHDDAGNLLFIHKKMGQDNTYFVMNQQDRELNRYISFRIKGKMPEVWDPGNGSMTRPAVYTMDGSYTTLPVSLKPYQSLLFIFKNEKPGSYISQVKLEGRQVFPSVDTSNIEQLPLVVARDHSFEIISSPVGGNFNFTDNHQRIYASTVRQDKVFALTDFTCRISFEPGYQASIPLVEVKKLGWLTESENPDVKYFSGTARYVLSFSFPAGEIQNTDSVLLDLGQFGSIAEVKLNGTPLGSVWKTGTFITVTSKLKQENTLEIAVVNPYRNRFIGDFAQYGKVQNLWTSAPVGDRLKKETPLRPSGLKGPVRFITISRQVLK